ncbi:replication protein A 70 kDa DNA-binding subunit D-like [Rhododendron vialii]|uniref:replication protein A 70 kDa DNA-binding subunit D-like n=1 Tax=Rhododendron vialii TaxID=182163 RepID=UPI00265D66DD|nr:replication protein A 70 kDa DNA-binding subunit D-like [Rhododendron vialii]XP_058180723.1 replication protein A 70 kDa DNA-binding subunit D-like [Rhododendron vialii]
MTFVRLTLWNEFAMRDGMSLLETMQQNIVLFATGLKVDDFHGPYLSTCKNRKLYVNHSICTDGILEWFAKDKNAQKSVAWNRTHEFSHPQALIISNARRIRINQFAFQANVNYYRVIGCIEKIYVEHLWIDLCNTCYNQVEDQYDRFMCNHCRREDVQTVTR